MIIAGVDCSTKKIAFFFIGDGAPFTVEIVDNGTEMTARVDSLFKQAFDVIKQKSPNIIYIENAAYLQNIKTTLSIHSAIDAVRFAAVLNNIPYQIIEITSWKKDVLGNGKADKAQIMSWAKAKYEALITSQDLADAAGIANYGYRRMVK